MSSASLVVSLPRTRLATIPGWAAAAIVALVLGLIAFGLVPRAKPLSDAQLGISSKADNTDLDLYKAINRRVTGGEGYYAAATAEQRSRGYPLRPFVTVRLPTLATVHATLGLIGAAVLMWSLVFATWLAIAGRLRRDLGPERPALYATALSAIGLGTVLGPPCLFWHEPWAAVLVALSLAVRTKECWGASVLIGLAAVAFRELALPYLCVMALAALLERRRSEAAGWVAAIGASACLLTFHAHMVSNFVTSADLHSPGWGGFGGWRFVLQMVHNYTSFSIAPLPVVAVLVPLSLLGWVAWRGAFGLRGALLLVGYIGAFMLVGRPDNDYWGMLMATLLPIGLVFAPAALRDLAVSMNDGWFTNRRVPAAA